MPHILPLLAALASAIAAAKLAGSLANRFGRPAVLGPPAIGLFGIPCFHDANVEETVIIIGQLGVIFLMFAAGGLPPPLK